MRILITIILLVLSSICLNAQVFPGAVGYGSDWIFPSYTVRKVTTLADSGAGSYRDAVGNANSLIVFEVAGYIDVQSTITHAQNIYIAGQTAFRYGGEGITLRKSSVWAGVIANGDSNTVMRYFRIRNGKADNSDCCGDNVLFSFKSNIVLDHMSFSHGNDELIDLSGSDGVTVQNSIIAEPLTEFAFALAKTVQGNGNNISFYRNIIANSQSRNPALSPLSSSSGNHYYELINNLAFQSESDEEQFRFSDGQADSPLNLNIIGNLVIRGAQSPQTARGANISVLGGLTAYVHDNIDGVYDTGVEDDWSFVGEYESVGTALSTSYKSLTALSTPIITNNNEILPVSSLESYLLSNSGAVLNGFRDNVDQRQVDDITAETSDRSYPIYDIANEGGYSTLSAMSGVEADSDGDGIPNSEEATWGDDTFGYVNSLVSSPLTPPTTVGAKKKSSWW